MLKRIEKVDTIIIGSGISAYFSKKANPKAMVIANKKFNNSIKSGGYFRTKGIQNKSIFESLNKIGEGLNETKKINYFCKKIKGIKNNKEFKNRKKWKYGFISNLNFLKNFQKEIINGELEEIIVKNNKILGAKIKINNKVIIFNCKSIILCSGGYTNLLLHNDSVDYGEENVIEKAFEKGAVIKDIEFLMFHPFCINNSCVATEKLINYKIFVSGKRTFWIENLLNKKKAHSKLSKISKLLAYNGEKLNAIKKNNEFLFLAHAHNSLGGLKVDSKNMSSIKGLFAAGEICAGLKGAGYIGGLSLSEGVIFGENAGKNSLKYNKKNSSKSNKFLKNEIIKSKKTKKDSKKIISKYFYVLNSKDNLKKGLKESKNKKNKFCEALFTVSLKRKKSRGVFLEKILKKKIKNLKKVLT
jgi:succinate dehydrogenase/fumarate reductase flavoprotein subunit